jgi:hypothetical protein
MQLLSEGKTLSEVGRYLESKTDRRWHPTQVARLRDRYHRFGAA